ncbi:MAG: acetoin utilization protein AcuB [Gammaproteobacteria bacterium]|jgi:acetoin utilization protein AcuB
MTPFPFEIGIGESIGNARRIMLQRKIHHLPVMENNELRGLVSDRDIKLILGPEFDYPDPKELTVEDAMVDDPYVVDSETSVIAVLDELARRHIGAALVTKKGRLVGIFSTSDACREFSIWLKREFHGSSGGSDIA